MITLPYSSPTAWSHSTRDPTRQCQRVTPCFIRIQIATKTPAVQPAPNRPSTTGRDSDQKGIRRREALRPNIFGRSGRVPSLATPPACRRIIRREKLARIHSPQCCRRAYVVARSRRDHRDSPGVEEERRHPRNNDTPLIVHPVRGDRRTGQWDSASRCHWLRRNHARRPTRALRVKAGPALPTACLG